MVNRRRRCGGFTLIEALLVLALSGVVLTLSAQIAVQTLDIQRTTASALDEQARADWILDSLAADLAARLPGDKPNAVQVRLDANHRPLIEITCLVAEPGDRLHTARIPAKVRYRLVRMPSETVRLRLDRIVQPLAGRSGVPWTVTVCDHLSSFEVTLHDGQQWLALTSKTAKQEHPPAAIRVEFRREADGAPATKTFVFEAPENQGSRL